MSRLGRSKSVFVGWTDHGRSRELAEAFSSINVPITPKSGAKAGLKYVDLVSRTWNRLRLERPDVVFFMQPPAPLLLSVWAYAIANKGVLLVGDLHSGYFNDSKWSWFTRLGIRMLQKHAVLVTNHNMATVAARDVNRVYVLHDLIVDKTGISLRESKGDGDPYLLCPLSYAADEPLEALLGAAALAPDVRWYFTGRAPDRIKKMAPANVVFTGFVTTEEYEVLLVNAAGVVALTDRADTMQRAGYEALAYGVPLLISDQVVLREFFQDSAVFVTHEADTIADGARRLVTADAWREALAVTRAERIREQQSTLMEIRRALLHE